MRIYETQTCVSGWRSKILSIWFWMLTANWAFTSESWIVLIAATLPYTEHQYYYSNSSYRQGNGQTDSVRAKLLPSVRLCRWAPACGISWTQLLTFELPIETGIAMRWGSHPNMQFQKCCKDWKQLKKLAGLGISKANVKSSLGISTPSGNANWPLCSGYLNDDTCSTWTWCDDTIAENIDYRNKQWWRICDIPDFATG